MFPERIRFENVGDYTVSTIRINGRYDTVVFDKDRKQLEETIASNYVGAMQNHERCVEKYGKEQVDV